VVGFVLRVFFIPSFTLVKLDTLDILQNLP